MKKQQDACLVPATNRGPKPADFPLGSLESRAAARMMANRRSEQERKEPLIYLAHRDENGKPLERKPEVVYHLWPGLLPVSEAERGRVPQLTEETNTPLSLPPPGESIDDPPPQPNKRQPVVTIEPDEPTTSKIFRGSGRSEIFIEIQ